MAENSIHTLAEADAAKPKTPHIALPLLLLALSISIWLIWMAITFSGLITAESLDVGQISRNFAQGKGFTTSIVLPVSLARIPDLNNHPALSTPPLFVLWEAFWFTLFHAGGKVAALASSLAWLLTVLLTYFFAHSLYNRKVALWAVIFLWLNPYFLNASISATSTSLAGFWVTAVIWLMAAKTHRPDEREQSLPAFPRRAFLFSAALIGLAALTDYDLAWALILPGLLYWLRRPAATGLNKPLVFNGSLKKANPTKLWLTQRLAPRLLFDYLLIVFIVCLPWLVRNYWVADDPFFSLKRFELLTQTAMYPGQGIFRHFENPGISVAGTALNHFSEISAKGLTGFTQALSGVILQMNPLLFMLFMFNILFPTPAAFPRIQRYALIMFIAYLLKLSFYSQQFERAMVFAPIIAVFGVGALFQRIDGAESDKSKGQTRHPIRTLWAVFRRSRRGKTLAVTILLSLCMLWSFRLEFAQNKQTLRPSANLPTLMDLTPDGQSILTASPWLVTWHGKLSTIWLPQTQSSLLTLDEHFRKRIHWVYFPLQRSKLSEDIVPEYWWGIISNPDILSHYAVHPSDAQEEWLFKRKP